MPTYSPSSIDYWNDQASHDVTRARYHWQSEPIWGIWRRPESDLHLLAESKYHNAIELGCGSAYIASWLARKGIKVIAIDYAEQQLKLASTLQHEFKLYFPLIQTNAQQLPFADASFDLAISEYGACTWCDPYRWLPEAARILRPNGKLIFVVNATLMMLCLDESGEKLTHSLQRDYFDQQCFEFANTPLVEFHLGYGQWIRLLYQHGLIIENLLELTPPEKNLIIRPDIPLVWAKRWPSEHIWIAKKYLS